LTKTKSALTPDTTVRQSCLCIRRAASTVNAFIEGYATKYAKATACLEKDRDALLAFYDFPAEHGARLR
jgi:transposase-like protein